MKSEILMSETKLQWINNVVLAEKFVKFYYSLVSPIFFQYWITVKLGDNLKNSIWNPFYEQGQTWLL